MFSRTITILDTMIRNVNGVVFIQEEKENLEKEAEAAPLKKPVAQWKKG